MRVLELGYQGQGETKQELEDGRLEFLFQTYGGLKEGQSLSEGWIDQTDIYRILKQIVGSQLEEEKLEAVINKTVQEKGDAQGRIDFEAFKSIFKNA